MKNTLARNAVFSVGYRLFNVVFPLISATYVSRVLSPEGIGRVNLAQNNMSYFLMIASLSMPYYGTREVAKRRNDPGKVNQVITELLLINLLTTTVAIFAYLYFVFRFFSGERLIYLVFCLELLFNYINVDWIYQGREEYRYITIRSAVVKVLSLVALLFFVRKPEDYLIYALVHCFGTGCNYFFNVFHLWGTVRLRFRDLKCNRHIKSLMALTVSSAAASLYSKVDISMLGIMSTESAVGFYTNAHKIISIVLTLVTAISAVFLPRLSYVYETDRAQYRRYLSIGLKVVLMLAIPGCVGLVLTSRDLASVLFGDAYLPMANTLQILSVLVLIKGAGDLLCYQAIISSGNERKLVISRIVAGIANVILNAIFIPRYSHWGAAVASVVSELIVNGMLLRYSLSVEKPEMHWHYFVSVSISTMLMALTVKTVQMIVDQTVGRLLLSVFLGFLVFVVGMIVTKNDMTAFLVSKLGRVRRKSK